MKVKELINQLSFLDPELEVFVNDNGHGEGASRLNELTVIPAIDAEIDGDEIDDEYYYTEDMSEDRYVKLRKSGYLLSEDGEMLYKNVLVIESGI